MHRAASCSFAELSCCRTSQQGSLFVEDREVRVCILQPKAGEERPQEKNVTCRVSLNVEGENVMARTGCLGSVGGCFFNDVGVMIR